MSRTRPGVSHRCTRRHRPERDDLSDTVAPVLVGDVVDDLVAAVNGEVDVDVGHRLAARVEEALEQQVVLDRVDVRDLEAVGDERAGRRAAARPHADPAPLRETHEVGHDQEVVGEAHLADRLELEGEAIAQLGRLLVVMPPQPLVAELDEVVERGAPVRRGERRQEQATELHRDAAPLGDLEPLIDRLGKPGEDRPHLVLRLEVELVGLEPPVTGVRERVARLDAEERLVRFRVLVAEVVDVGGGDEREPQPFRERRRAAG